MCFELGGDLTPVKDVCSIAVCLLFLRLRLTLSRVKDVLVCASSDSVEAFPASPPSVDEI